MPAEFSIHAKQHQGWWDSFALAVQALKRQ